MNKRSKKTPAEWVSIDSVTPWDKNPRVNDHAVDSVAASIQRFGWGSPLIVRAADSVVIAGHTRLKAARKLGLDKVLVRYLDLDPAEAAALALADNKLNELASWDDDALRDIISELSDQTIQLDGLGWNDEQISAILSDPSLTDISDSSDTEVDVDGFNLAHECPRCGFSFDD
jgi:ParB-like chromosome segregation protein Spo0J